MITLRKTAAITLLGTLTCCLTSSLRGDELNYLPDKNALLISVNVQSLLKSKAYAATKARHAEVVAHLEKYPATVTGVFFRPAPGELTILRPIAYDKIARYTAAASHHGAEVKIITMTEPVKASDIGVYANARGGFTGKTVIKKVTYEEVKAGKHTIYEQTIEAEVGGKTITAKGRLGYCVPEKNIIVIGEVEVLHKIFERDQAPEVSANMRAGLKLAGLDNALSLVVDLGDADVRDELVRQFKSPGLADVAGSLQTLAVKVNETAGCVQVNAAVICKNAASAADVHAVAKEAVPFAMDQLKAEAKASLHKVKMIQAVRAVLGDAKLAAPAGNQVSASVAIDPAAVASMAWAVLPPVYMPPPKEKTE